MSGAPGAIHVERRVRAALEADAAELRPPARPELAELARRRRRSRLVPVLVAVVVVVAVGVGIAVRPDAPVVVDPVTGEADVAAEQDG